MIDSQNWREWLLEQAEIRGAQEYMKHLKESPTVAGLTCTATELWLAPIKSFGMVPIEDSLVVISGRLQTTAWFRDKGAMIAIRNPGRSKNGHPYEYTRFSQAEFPELTLIDGSIGNVERGRIRYSAPGHPPLIVSPDMLMPQAGAATVNVKMAKSTPVVCSGVVENGLITRWLRMFLERYTQKVNPQDVVVLLSPEAPVDWRQRDMTVDVLPLCCDGPAVHIVNATTVDWMNVVRIREGTMPRIIPHVAFRPNIVLRNLNPNLEDLIGVLGIGSQGMQVQVDELCRRCSVPGINMVTGKIPDKDPQKWLLHNRPPSPQDTSKTTLGLYGTFLQDGLITRNDSCTILSEKTET